MCRHVKALRKVTEWVNFHLGVWPGRKAWSELTNSYWLAHVTRGVINSQWGPLNSEKRRCRDTPVRPRGGWWDRLRQYGRGLTPWFRANSVVAVERAAPNASCSRIAIFSPSELFPELHQPMKFFLQKPVNLHPPGPWFGVFLNSEMGPATPSYLMQLWISSQWTKIHGLPLPLPRERLVGVTSDWFAAACG